MEYVLKVERTVADGYQLISKDGTVHSAKMASRYKRDARHVFDLPAVGDLVNVSPPSDPADPSQIEGILQRRTILCRKHPKKMAPQILASNLDYAIIVLPPNGQDTAKRAERYMVAALGGGAEPVVVINISYTLSGKERVLAYEAVRLRLGPDVRTAFVSAATKDGLGRISELLSDGSTAALIGPSGVGKSTMTNALVEREVMKTATRSAAKRGRRTTVHRQLVPAAGGFLVDTPGLDDIIPWGGRTDLMHCPAATDGLALCFPDIEELVSQCAYSNCSHSTDAGCALAAALTDCRLSQERLDSYFQIYEDTDIPDLFGADYKESRGGGGPDDSARLTKQQRYQKHTRSGYRRR